MRITIVTDAWHPQPNGVVRVNDTLRQTLERRGHEVQIVEPSLFRTVPCPTYPDIPLAVLPGRKVAAMITEFHPDAIHIATEGPLGLAARGLCRRRGWPFTTAYHTKFPEYIAQRTRLPLKHLYALMRWFHGPSAAVLCPSPSVQRDLAARGFTNARAWSHGVDTELFHPQPKDFLDLPRPIYLYVGRITVEKNLPAFLDLDLSGSKVVVGTGPQREALEKRYPQVHFRTAFGDRELSRYFASGDVFVFPSTTDTFGLVMLEAMASGVPVAAFPVTGPRDVIGTSRAGIMDTDLRAAALAAIKIDPAQARAHALTFSWDRVADEFLGFLAPLPGHARAPEEDQAALEI
ncbi:glycosyltransferase family 4 protein [Pararhodospirillum photometricum]|uniref:Glycosyl transferase, group 1 n=1 Tax=Pararhodospirillum photometricum DSM 122 TaxID=1150469 RepID=H6SP26_PARPM|nr:glycosyltransferase family 1 protein [Pararhodospirillum photometricum]CCG07098.1 Glycosyl transferase, group 1 [Pararhodospirillum photometricum DSM 122]